MKFFIILLLAVATISAASPERRTDVKSMITSMKGKVAGFFGDQAATFGTCLKTKGLAEAQTLAKDMMTGVAKSIAAKFGMRRLGLLGNAANFVKGKACAALKGAATTACNNAAKLALSKATCPTGGKLTKACTSSWANVIKPCVEAEVPAVCDKLVAAACPSRRRLVSVRRTSVADMMKSMKGKVAGFFGDQAATFGTCLKTKGLAEAQTLAKDMMTGVARSIAAKFGMRRLGLLSKVGNFVKGKACAAFKGAATSACNKAANAAINAAQCPSDGKFKKACTSSWANVIKPCVVAEVPAVCDKLVAAACPARRLVSVRRTSVADMMKSMKAKVAGFFGEQSASFGTCLKTKGLAEGQTLAKDMMAGVARSIAAKFGMRRLGLLGNAANFVKGKACAALKGPATSACVKAANAAINTAQCPSDGKFTKACTSSWANVIKPCVVAEVAAVCDKLVAKAC